MGKLITADPKTTIEALIKDHKPTAVSTDDDQEKAARLLQDLDVLVLPVCSTSPLGSPTEVAA